MTEAEKFRRALTECAAEKATALERLAEVEAELREVRSFAFEEDQLTPQEARWLLSATALDVSIPATLRDRLSGIAGDR